MIIKVKDNKKYGLCVLNEMFLFLEMKYLLDLMMGGEVDWVN